MRKTFLVACYATLHPALSVHTSVRPLVRLSHFTFFGFCGLWPHCTCPNDEVTSITAPAHPHATGVAVYPTLFPLSSVLSLFSSSLSFCHHHCVSLSNIMTTVIALFYTGKRDALSLREMSVPSNPLLGYKARNTNRKA